MQPQAAPAAPVRAPGDGARARNAQQAGAILRTHERADHEGKLAAATPDDLDAKLAKTETDLITYLAEGLGGSGRSWFKPSSDGRKALQAAAREQARQAAAHDADMELAQRGDLADKPAAKRYYELRTRSEVDDKAKGSVDSAIHATAEAWVHEAWNLEALKDQAKVVAGNRAWEVLKANPDSAAKLKEAIAQGRKAAHTFLETAAVSAKKAIRTRKNAFVKPKTAQGAPAQPSAEASHDKQALLGSVADQTKHDQVGKKTVETAIRANTTEEGLGAVGKMLDQVVPMAGEQASFSIKLQIPVDPSGTAFVSLELDGTAARGMDGAVTAGVPIFGHPHRLEVMGQFKLGAGAQAFGVKADLTVGFFVRGGADSTADCMKALSYGSYRAATGINRKLGNWWAAGSAKTAGDASPAERAEAWAAMVEEQVFAGEKDEAGHYKGTNAFAHTGITGGADASFKVAGVGAAASATVGKFTKYDKSMRGAGALGDDRFARPVTGLDGAARETAAKARQDAAGSSKAKSYAFSASANVSILGQGVAFAASLSGNSAGDWGIQISAALGLAVTSTSGWKDKLAKGILNGALSAAENVVALVAKDKEIGPTIDLAADVTRLADAGLADQITQQVAKQAEKQAASVSGGLLAPTSQIQVALLFGKRGGKGTFRVELRDTTSTTVTVGVGSASLSVQLSKSKRVAAIGYDQGKWNTEALGVRAAKTGAPGDEARV